MRDRSPARLTRARTDAPALADDCAPFEVHPPSPRYNGSGVWRFVHQKICFQDDLDLPQNSWKRDFNRGVAGLHSCVSASIIRDILDTDGDEQKALAEYRRRYKILHYIT